MFFQSILTSYSSPFIKELIFNIYNLVNSYNFLGATVPLLGKLQPEVPSLTTISFCTYYHHFHLVVSIASLIFFCTFQQQIQKNLQLMLDRCQSYRLQLLWWMVNTKYIYFNLMVYHLTI